MNGARIAWLEVREVSPSITRSAAPQKLILHPLAQVPSQVPRRGVMVGVDTLYQLNVPESCLRWSAKLREKESKWTAVPRHA
jgi:hypothetical protein